MTDLFKHPEEKSRKKTLADKGGKLLWACEGLVVLCGERVRRLNSNPKFPWSSPHIATRSVKRNSALDGVEGDKLKTIDHTAVSYHIIALLEVGH